MPSASENSPRGAPALSTRDRLIRAAVDALRDLTVPQLISAVGTREIARRAGVSPASLFHHFSSVETLAEAVVADVFDPDRVPVGSLLDTLFSLIRSHLPLDIATTLHSSEFDRLVADDLMRVRTGLWSLGGPGMDEVHADYVASVDARIEASAAALFDSWGTELRPPWTMRSFLKTQSALLSGSVIRHLVRPEPMDRQNFIHAAATLTLTSLRLKGFNHDVTDRLRDLNHYPTQVDLVAERDQTAGPIRLAILAAAADLFVKRGYDHTKMGQIARLAAVSESTVYAHFDSKRSLASELFRTRTKTLALDRGIALDTGGAIGTGSGSTPPHAVRDFVAVVADCAYMSKEIAPAFLAEQSDIIPTPDWIVHHLAVLLSPMLSSTVDEQEPADRPRASNDLEVRELAWLMVVAVVRRTLVLPDESASDSATRVLSAFELTGDAHHSKPSD